MDIFKIVFLLSIFGAFIGTGCSSDSDNSNECKSVSAKVQFDVPYIIRNDTQSDEMTVLDIYPPEEPGCNRPIVIWVHGGAWSLGDKSQQISDKIPFFHELGAVFVSINYRLTTRENSVQHPDHVNDVAAAFAWARAHATEYGANPERIILLGHSAGAHLVALVATNPRFLATHSLLPSDIACVGSYDTRYSVSDIVDNNSAYEAVFTSDTVVWEDASPSAHIGPNLPPFQLACRGTNSRITQCETFAGDLRTAGVEATTIDASPLDHDEVNSMIGLPQDQVMTPPLRAFIENCIN